jgi:hypothetical protein
MFIGKGLLGIRIPAECNAFVESVRAHNTPLGCGFRASGFCFLFYAVCFLVPPSADIRAKLGECFASIAEMRQQIPRK